MEYLYNINPILQQTKEIIIYGIGEDERAVFMGLLQQNVSIMAFALKKGQKSGTKRILNKRVISFDELKDNYYEAKIIVCGIHAPVDVEELYNSGIKNIIIENITLKNRRMVLLDV